MVSSKTRAVAWCIAAAAVIAGWAVLANLAVRVNAYGEFMDKVSGTSYSLPDETLALVAGIGLILTGVILGFVLVVRAQQYVAAGE